MTIAAVPLSGAAAFFVGKIVLDMRKRAYALAAFGFPVRSLIFRQKWRRRE